MGDIHIRVYTLTSIYECIHSHPKINIPLFVSIFSNIIIYIYIYIYSQKELTNASFF